jgi:hypothetical protein
MPSVYAMTHRHTTPAVQSAVLYTVVHSTASRAAQLAVQQTGMLPASNADCKQQYPAGPCTLLIRR